MKSNRATLLRDLRPNLDLAIDPNSPAEKFQNEVLRPILKFQNELLVALFAQYLRKRKTNFQSLSAEKQLEYIAKSVQQDRAFRNMLLGTVIGLFSESEWEKYIELEAELSRRIANLIIQRLQSQMELF